MSWLKNFKTKHVKPTIAYKLYRLAKYKPAKTYGAWGEDTLLDRLFRNTDYYNSGIFVDVGCNHPVVGSMTWKLYKRGWRGLNLDLTEENIRLCKTVRPQDTSVQCAITSESGEVASYIFDPGSGLNTLEKSHADEWAVKIGKPYQIKMMPAMPLDAAIEKYMPGKEIKFLTIDVEGHELSVLKTFSFAKYSPEFILCEIHGRELPEVMKSPTYNLLVENKYRLISYAGGSGIFVRLDVDYRF